MKKARNTMRNNEISYKQLENAAITSEQTTENTMDDLERLARLKEFAALQAEGDKHFARAVTILNNIEEDLDKLMSKLEAIMQEAKQSKGRK